MIIYYLLYKIYNSTILWIVDVNINFYELYDTIKNFKSNKESYYIAQRRIRDCDIEKALSFKRFQQFQLKKTHKILATTNNICHTCTPESNLCIIL